MSKSPSTAGLQGGWQLITATRHSAPGRSVDSVPVDDPRRSQCDAM